MKIRYVMCSMAIVMAILLVSCSHQQGLLQSTNIDTENSAKTEGKISEHKTGELSGSASVHEEIEDDERNIANRDVVDWSAISANGVNEELFAEKLNIDDLQYIAQELQTLVQEEYEDERENPEILLTQGWTRVFSSEHYKNVITMGDSAKMPLYWIIYKSPNTGQYEYICATALYEISGYDFSNKDGSLKWATSKELLELFNAEILNE